MNFIGQTTIGEHKLYWGDCLEIMPRLPDKSIDMIFADLPYGTTKNKWDVIIPFDSLWKQYERIIKNNGAIILTASQPFTSLLVTSNLNLFKYSLVWEKSAPSNIALANSQPLKYHEDVCVFYKSQPIYNPQKIPRDEKGIERILAGQKSGVSFKMTETDHQPNRKYTEYSPDRYDPYLKNPSSVIKIKNERGKKHPTQKPVKLMEWMIKTYTDEGELVLDNAMGSGSTGEACINLNRKFIGIEKDEKYFEIAYNRLTKVYKEIQSKQELV